MPASVPSPSRCVGLNLAGGVWRAAVSRPDSPALVLDGRTLSYAALARQAQRVAAWLRGVERAAGAERRAGEAARVGILAARSVATYAGILGAAWAGGTYVALNPRQPPSRIASVMRRARLSALLADERGAGLLDHEDLRSALPRAVTTWDEMERGDASQPVRQLQDVQDDPPAEVSPTHPAYILFTSGTTGEPKGVIVSTGSVAQFLAQMRERYAIGPDDRCGQVCETSFDLSVFELFAAWDGGASLHVVPEAQTMAPAPFIRREALTVWTSVPSVISMLARMKMLEPGTLPGLRLSYFIGEALPVQAARAWMAAAPNSVVDNHYGPTEATVACTVQRVAEPVAETPGRGIVAIGKAYAGMEAEVLAEDGAFLEAGEAGELVLSGGQLADGYLGDPELTAQRFPVLDHPRLGKRRWYRSGDLASRDREGVLHWLGRIDRQVKILGHRVELEDVEAHLREASGTDAVAAVAWPLRDGAAEGIVAFVCGAAAAPREIRQRLRASLPAYMAPRRIVALDALPLSPNGKVDRSALQALLEAAS